MAITPCPKCGARNRVDERASTLQPVCGRCGARLPVAATVGVLVVTDQTFSTAVLQADRPVVLDCWAPWCGPCQMISPIMEELSREYSDRYVVAKLNTDENRMVATQFRIDAIPTLLFFKNGRLVDRIVGLAPKQTIAQKLAAL